MDLYCDCSFDIKKGIAGFGIVLIDGQKRREFSNWTRCRTVNAGELFAIYQAGILAEQVGIVHTDSQTAIQYINNDVKDKPRTREQYLNHLECKYWACKIRKLGVKVEKVKAHKRDFNNEHLNNNLADVLSRMGRSKFYR